MSRGIGISGSYSTLAQWVVTIAPDTKLTTPGSRQRAHDKGLTTKGSQRGSTTNHLQTRGSLTTNDLIEGAYENTMQTIRSRSVVMARVAPKSSKTGLKARN